MMQIAENPVCYATPVVDIDQVSKIRTVIHSNKKREDFSGIWESERGSRYLCDGRSFVCISIHSVEYIGWIGRIAVKVQYQTGAAWSGQQAIRDRRSGELSHWIPVVLNIDRHRVSKQFPAEVGSEILVNGHHETYRRVQI
jgi:hypothetical protein